MFGDDNIMTVNFKKKHLTSRVSKDENAHRFALRVKLLEREKEREIVLDIIYEVQIIHSKDYTWVTHYP